MVVSTSVLGVEMFSKLKKLTYRVLLIGNIIVILLMLFVGCSISCFLSFGAFVDCVLFGCRC